MMRRLLTAIPIALVAAVACSTSAPAARTDGGTASTNCTPGESVGCAGPGACSGFQVCASNGARYELCSCTSEPDAAPPVDAGPDANDVHVAACGGLPGLTTSSMTADVERARVLGRWWPCHGPAPSFLDYPLELTAEGSFYPLSYVNGAFVRNLGTSGTYVVTPVTVGAGGFQLVATSTSSPNEPHAMRLGLEVMPDRLLLDSDSWVRLDAK